MQVWSEAFVEYYNIHLRPDIIGYSAKWVIEQSGATYNPLSDITNNAAESMNRVLHRLQGDRELPIDQCVLGLFYLQNSYIAEIQRGRAGLGNYTLREDYLYAKIQPEEMLLPALLYHPDDIINAMKGQLDGIITPVTRDNSSDSDSVPSNSSALDDMDTVDELKQSRERVSQNALAKACAHANRVKHVPELGAFVVRGARGDKYAVSLFPEKCQCPSTGICYHIKAVWIFIGRTGSSTKDIRNLTVLRKIVGNVLIKNVVGRPKGQEISK
jgi:hypothetical protein